MMAVGGVVDLSNLEQFTENLQEQSDEITVLQSIFEGDEGRLQIITTATKHNDATSDEHGDATADCMIGMEDCSSNMLKLFVPFKFDEKIHVDVHLPQEKVDQADDTKPERSGMSIKRSESGQRVIWSFEVTYLTPLCLHITLPQTYPSHDAPVFNISCLWLSPLQLSAVCEQLDRLWMENKEADSPGMPILYTWLDWLQENLLSFLGIEGQISVTAYELDEDVDDCRIDLESTDLDMIVTKVMRYDRQETVRQFYLEEQECGICFDSQPGNKFYLLLECGHHVCKECMAAHCQLLVKEGTVQQLRCPSHKCKASIPEYVLKEVLTEEQFRRYDKLALQKALDMMGDVTYCPRCSNVVIREPEEDLNMARCATCFYTFCTDCNEAWHHSSTCQVILDRQELERKRELQRKAKLEEEDAEAKRVIQQKLENMQSNSYVKKMSKKCPSCRSPIMKIGGCNKVMCSICHKSMCWVCNRAIVNYSHFSESPDCNTFTTGADELVDNRDMPNMYGAPPPPPPPPEPPRRNTYLLITQRLKLNPDLQRNVFTCTTCKQKNLRETNMNHIVCWNCRTNLCGNCKQRIVGAIGKHFSGYNSCPQHS